MKIYGVYNVSDTYNKTFVDNVSDRVNELQQDGQTVEVQYQTCIMNSSVVYSALIIGRK